jgi:hypothetical protein
MSGYSGIIGFMAEKTTAEQKLFLWVKRGSLPPVLRERSIERG